LAVEGLAGAVRNAAEHAQGAVTIVELPAERLPERVERAAYRFITDCLREMAQAQAPDLSIAVRRTGRDVIVELACDRATTGQWYAAYLDDRVAAVGGQLQRTAEHGHQRLIAILPFE
jgi:glucose-6-phosphate-specific signal transduction histidine kinase